MSETEMRAWEVLRSYDLDQYVSDLKVFEQPEDFGRYITRERIYFRPNSRFPRWEELPPAEQVREKAETEQIIRYAEAETFISRIEPVAVNIALNLDRMKHIRSMADITCTREQRFIHAVLHEAVHARDFVRAKPDVFDYTLIRPFVLTAEVLALRGVYDLYREKRTEDLDYYLNGYLFDRLTAFFDERLQVGKELSAHEFGQMIGIALIFQAQGIKADNDYIEDLYNRLLMELLAPEFTRIADFLRPVRRLTREALAGVNEILELTAPLVQYRFTFANNEADVTNA